MSRRRKDNAPTGRESWAIVGADGTTLREMRWGKHAALALAQVLALGSPSGSTLTVEHRHLIGPTTRLYRVERLQTGVETAVLVAAD